MSSIDDSGAGIRILSFDNGGPGTYSQLLLLNEYMRRIASDLDVDEDDIYPADYFDLMGGVGFGGLVAFMLGYLRMNVNQAMDALLTVAVRVFPLDSLDTVNPETSSLNLKEAIEARLEAGDVPLGTKMYDKTRSSRCKVALYAVASANMNHSQVFRTYASRQSSLNPTIVESIRATMSIPSLFLPVNIGPRLREQSFVGGAIGGNNPTRELIREAEEVFGQDRRVAQIISLGSGLTHPIALGSLNGTTGVLKGIAADCEVVANELSTRLYSIDAYLRLNVGRGMEDITLTDWSRLGDIVTHTSVYLATATVAQALEASLRRLKNKLGTVTLQQLNHSSSVKVTAKTVPALSAYHVVRAESAIMLKHLAVPQSSRRKIFVVTGMGGCGKTQMVSYFLHENPSLYKYVVFVDASSSSSIQADLQVWAQALGDGHERDVWEDSLRILSSGSTDEQSALVLDNADEPTLDITQFLPEGKGVTVIITSRNRNLGNLSTTYHLELGEMGKDEALSTLLRAARRNLPLPAEELKCAQALINELGSLAVALVHAGAYCYEMSSMQHGVPHPYTFTQYLSLFHSHRADLMRRPGPASLDRYQKGVYTTLDILYAALPQVAREFLHFISFFHHTDIPLAAIAANADQGFQEILSYFPRPESYSKVISDLKQLLCMDDKWNELKIQEIILTLRSFSLVSTTSIDDNLFLQLHPLTQAWSKDKVDSRSPNYNDMVVCALTSPSRRDTIRLYRYLLPHITGMLDQHEVHHLHINDLMAAGRLFNEQGQFASASKFIEAALELAVEYTKTLPLDIIASLAVAYDGEGRWGEAEELKLEVLKGRKRGLGDNHVDTIKAAAHLAATYQGQGRWKEAEKLGEAVLEWRARNLGNEHEFTIDAAASLAITYCEEGMLNYAEMLEVGVLTLCRKRCGRDHTESIMAAAQLATTYYNQFRFKEAETLQVEVLEKRKKILGLEHPETIKTAANLANTYSVQGRLSEAEVLLVDALGLLRRTRGPEHSETILAESNLSLLYFSLGRREEATTLIESAVRLSLKVMGAKHPSTQRHLKVIVTIYEQLGRQADAQVKRALLIS